MLFSDKKIADYINENFESTWESVRPVPIVTIDFGNGKKLTRTFRGNIGTYVCTADGFVVDVLPGLYSANAFLKQLRALHATASAVSHSETRSRGLAAYHSVEMGKGSHAVATMVPDGMEDMLASGRGPGHKSPLPADTSVNETERRALIHGRLLSAGLVRPEQLTKWLYRDVLHADIDDPYLGIRGL